MPLGLLIGIAAGLASAVLYASAGAGTGATGVILRFLSPLPGLIAALGWGPRSGLVAAIAAGAAAAGFLDGLRTMDLLGSQMLPAILLAHLVMLGRQAPPESGGGMEWYPLGRVLATATLIAGGIASWRLYHIGGSAEAIKARVGDVLAQLFKGHMPALEGRTLSPQDIDNIAQMMTQIAPPALAAMWLVGMLVNVWLAGRVTSASGLLTRPWPDLAAVVAPPGFAIGLAVAVAASWAPGTAGFYGSAIAGAFVTAYALIGLSIVHAITRSIGWRGPILFFVYAALLVLSVWAIAVLALIALAEPIAPWSRGRPTGRPP